MTRFGVMFLGAAALSYLLAFPTRQLALRLGAVDKPEKRKVHQIPIPLMGGVALFFAFSIVTAVAFFVFRVVDASMVRPYLGLMAGGLIILALGIYDDVFGARPLTKFAGQTLAALVVVAMGARIQSFTNPLGMSFEFGEWVGIPLVMLWIVGVTNAVNLIDGLDGLAVGIGAIAAIGLFSVAAPGNAFVAGAAIALAGAGVGLLPHNFYPAKLFLGDAGSMFIGYTLSVIGLQGSFKATTATVLFLPIIVLGVPLLDTFFAIFRRAKRRVSPFKADREHIHHRLVRIGLHHRNVVLVLYFACAYLALTAYSVAHLPYQTALSFLVLLVMGGIIGLRTLQFIEERLEVGLKAAARSEGAPQSESRRSGGRPVSWPGTGVGRRQRSFSSILCEVGGFREDFGEPAELDAMSSDIRSMLSRRVRVDAILIEPLAPGRLLLLIRTSTLTTPLAALVRDGLSWYLDDHRDRFAGQAPFPRVTWLGASSAAGEPAEPDPDDAGVGEGPVFKGDARVAGSRESG